MWRNSKRGVGPIRTSVVKSRLIRPTGRAAVLGSPIRHSLSPALHRAAYAALGVAQDWTYTAEEVDNLAGLTALLGQGPWSGWSLTMPLKTQVQGLLPKLTEVAAATGSVNTVLFAPAGPGTSVPDSAAQPVLGDNTDVAGLVAALAELGVVAGAAVSAVIVGGGATACSALAALLQLGVPRPQVVLRDAARGGALLHCAEQLGGAVQLLSWNQGVAAVSAAQVVLSTVPASACAAALDLGVAAAPDAVLLDVLYHPWPTPLLASWWKAGRTASGGLPMLVQQAAAQVQLMTGLPVGPQVVAAMRAAGELKLGRSAADTPREKT